MKRLSIGHLNMEIGKISMSIQKKDKNMIEHLYRTYTKELSIPSKDVIHYDHTTVISKYISYHLLSTYYLLDLIDFYWDGKDFQMETLNHALLFKKELSYQQPSEMEEIEHFKEMIERISSIIPRRFYIFLYPFTSKEEGQDYVTYDAMPGTVLIIFGNEKGKVKESIYEGVANFYINSILEGKLPNWAKSEDELKKEIIFWCKKSPSRFK